MKKRALRRAHNVILKTIGYIMGLVFILSTCAMDSECLLLPAVLCAVSGGYLALFAYANGMLGRRCM